MNMRKNIGLRLSQGTKGEGIDSGTACRTGILFGQRNQPY